MKKLCLCPKRTVVLIYIKIIINNFQTLTKVLQKYLQDWWREFDKTLFNKVVNLCWKKIPSRLMMLIKNDSLKHIY